MDFSETLFQKVHRAFRRFQRQKNHSETRVYLSDLSSRLQNLAAAITGRNLEIIPVQYTGGYNRTQICLPESIDLFQTSSLNEQYYFFRTGYSSLASILPGKEEPLQILMALKRRLPSLFATAKTLSSYLKPEQTALLIGERLQDVLPSELGVESLDTSDNEETSEDKKVSEKKIRSTANPEVVPLDRQKVEEYCLQHHFEKIETAEEFNGNWRLPDGEDELEDHDEALDEITFDSMVRLDAPVHAITSSSVSVHTKAFDTLKDSQSVPGAFYYDEWDAKKRIYRKNWCRLIETTPAYSNTQIPVCRLKKDKLTKELLRIRSMRRLIPKHEDGEHLDLDAVLDAFVDIRSQKTPTERIYQKNLRLDPGFSILILLDLSLSTDSYLQNVKILDIIREAAALAGDTLNSCGIHFEIAGFRSRTRHECTYVNLHSFHESWDDSKRRLATIRPEVYTRIGPAIRHGSFRLRSAPDPKKAMLLVTDAKPSDFDQYEGYHGMRDVARALNEARQEGIHLHAITLQSQAMAQLDSLLGHREYELVRSVNELGPAMVSWVRRMLCLG